MTAIGWYVHHHGHGHLARFLAVRPHLDARVVALSSLPRPTGLPAGAEWIELPRDDHDEGEGAPALASPTAGGSLHWAPLRHRGHARRLAAIAALAPELDAMVVDVSVEVTALARLLGLPVVLVAQPGERTDAPHALGRRLAEAIVAPWPTPAGDPTGSPFEHVGGISRHAGRPRTAAARPGTVLALGGGAHDPEWTALVAAAAGASGRTWRIAGAGAWLDDPWTALCEAEVVVTAAGQNAIADVAAAGARAVVLPRPRPFAEQRATATLLGGLGLAVVADDLPDAGGLERLVDAAAALEPDWTGWGVEGAAARLAAVVARVARTGRVAA
ncbi:hypothetical protein [Agrococcus terreus]|uniref:Glycosyl transferase family 28 C-terminal domain-containing protein n=1 Tax=Agrococcus terreus TaxID=574649 RepID=A0ABQ2KMZ0_9MICO|nr:hypothetical protein [Agrococcus terreus]GGN88157.1 hypothetical protein GCM10010968_23450 [Agrococcus terreus]